MRIAIVNSFYKSGPSGENQMVLNETKALSDRGHEVKLFAKTTPTGSESLLYSIPAGLRVATGRGQNPLADINQFKPDIVHIQNLFPNWSTNWVTKLDSPFVTTLHNYRTLCAAGTLSRAGEPCTLCPSQGSINSIKHKCYRGGAFKTLPLAIASRPGRLNPVIELSARIILKTELSKNMFSKFWGSKLEQKARVIPNFVRTRTPKESGFNSPQPEPQFWLFVGRLSREKGILELIKSWPAQEELIVVGDGPLKTEAENLARGKHISFLGNVPNHQVPDLMVKAIGLAIPSLWSEHLPLVMLEALSNRVPVLTTDGTTVSEIVHDSRAGEVFTSFTELPNSLARIKLNRHQYSINAENIYRTKFSEKSVIPCLERLYQEVILERGGHDIE